MKGAPRNNLLPTAPHALPSPQAQHNEGPGVLTWGSQVDHISVTNIDGPVTVYRTENLNQVSRLWFWLQNQEQDY